MCQIQRFCALFVCSFFVVLSLAGLPALGQQTTSVPAFQASPLACKQAWTRGQQLTNPQCFSELKTTAHVKVTYFGDKPNGWLSTVQIFALKDGSASEVFFSPITTSRFGWPVLGEDNLVRASKTAVAPDRIISKLGAPFAPRLQPKLGNVLPFFQVINPINGQIMPTAFHRPVGDGRDTPIKATSIAEFRKKFLKYVRNQNGSELCFRLPTVEAWNRFWNLTINKENVIVTTGHDTKY